MKKLFLGMLLLATVTSFFYGDADNFGFKPLRRKLRYVEEFYRLYTQNHMASTDSIGRNIVYLQYALNSPYIHPIKALCNITTRAEHAKYKLLLRCRIAFLIAKGFVQYGYRYDKQDVLYFNLEFKKELKDSFKIAAHYYKEAVVYWKEAKRVAALAVAMRKIRLKGGHIEAIIDEAKRIHYGVINYQRVINFRMRELARKNRLLETLR